MKRSRAMQLKWKIGFMGRFGAPLILLAAAVGSRAGLDPELEKPYQVRVVFHFGESPLMTPQFREQVKREVGESLQASLGEMGQVKTETLHPLIKVLEKKGLKGLDELQFALTALGKPDAVKRFAILKDLDDAGQAELKAWKQLDPIKTFFVFVDYADDRFFIQVRQHEGCTGQLSPLRDPDSTPDREFVGRTATIRVAKEFGLIATVVSQSSKDQFQVAFWGGMLDDSLAQWVKKNDLLAMVEVLPNTAATPSRLIRRGFLQVLDAPARGSCLCQYIGPENQDPPPLVKAGSGEGVRCVKLNTTRGPLRLRLIKDDPKVITPEPNVQIQVRARNFREDDKLSEKTDRLGRFSSESRGTVYDQVAYLSVFYQGVVTIQTPVPIYEEGYFDCPVNLKPDPKAQINFSISLWTQRLFEKSQLTSLQLTSLNAAPADKLESTLELTNSELNRLDEDITRLENQYKSLKEELNRLRLPPSRDREILTGSLNRGESQLAELKKGRKYLADFKGNLEARLQAKNDPKNLEILELSQKAQNLESQAEFGQALDIYKELEEKLKAAGRSVTEVAAHAEKLRKVWTPKSDDHKKARDFVYRDWPNLDYNGAKAELDGFKKQVDKARKALETCKKADDYLTIIKLSKGTDGLLGRMQAKYSSLLPTANQNIDEAEQVANLDVVIKSMSELLKDITSYLEEKKSASP